MSSGSAESGTEPTAASDLGTTATTSSLTISSSSMSLTTTDTPVEDMLISGCSVWLQDCPQGQKCVGWDSGTEVYTRCVVEAEMPSPVGAPCVFSQDDIYIESCVRDAFCWFRDTTTNTGVCVPICEGTVIEPLCPPASRCVIFGQYDQLNLCLPICDPLVDICPEFGGVCEIPLVCWDPFDIELPAFGEECWDALGACASGFTCVGGENFQQCDSSCCTSFCDLSQPGDCPESPVQECVPFGAEPPLEHVGLCLVP